MTDHVVPGSVPPSAGVQAMQRLADRLTGLVPPQSAAPLASSLPQPSPAVTAALAKSAKQAKSAAARAGRATAVGRIASGLVFVPYSVAALILRIVLARVFFLDGQGRVDGLHYTTTVHGFDFSVIVPTSVKVETVASIFDYTESALLSTVVAYVISYAEFALPILLVLGIGTRFVALALLGLTVVMQLYLTPQDLWSAHIYWGSILVVLISLGAGQISVDRLVKLVARRS